MVLSGVDLSGAVDIIGVSDQTIANSVLRAPVQISATSNVQIVGNTIHDTTGADPTFTASSALLRNNLVLNWTGDQGWVSQGGSTVDSDYQAYQQTLTVLEANSLIHNPGAISRVYLRQTLQKPFARFQVASASVNA